MKCLLCMLLILLQVTLAAQSINPIEQKVRQADSIYNIANYRDALRKFNEAVDVALKTNNYNEARKAYNGIGNCYAQLGEHVLSLSHYQKALKLPGVRTGTDRARIYKNIGALYSEQKDFDTAIEYYNLALDDARAGQDSILMGDCLNNIGVVQEQLKDYNAALSSYTSALEIYRKEKVRQRISVALNNLAIVYKALGKFENALQFYKEAMSLAELEKDAFTIAATHNNIGNLYSAMGKHRQALDYCRLAYSQAKAIEATEVVIEALDGMAEAYENLADYRGALKYRKEYEDVLQTYISSSRTAELAELRIQYDTELKDASIRELQQKDVIRRLQIDEQKQKLQSRTMLLLGFLILLAALLAAAWFRLQRQRLRAEAERQRAIVETEEQERLRIARDIHDDLGSGLSKINFLSELILQKSAQDPEIHENTVAVRETATKMIGNMRDLIWALNPENTTLANLIARIREYSTDYLGEFPISVHYNFPDEVPNNAITKESHRDIFMVVKESTNNIVKHSLATRVEIEIKLDDSFFTLSITDNGRGIDPEHIPGNGLSNMRKRMAGLSGTVQVISSETGTKIIATVPILVIQRNIAVTTT
jgi:two-component system sensor histidine kinase UhpB